MVRKNVNNIEEAKLWMLVAETTVIALTARKTVNIKTNGGNMNNVEARAILGVPSTATQEQIKARYKKLAMQYHPDRSSGDAQQFRAVQEAYMQLNKSVCAKCNGTGFFNIFEGCFKRKQICECRRH